MNKKKIQEPIWFYSLIVLMFFVTIGIIATIMLGRFDSIGGIIKGAAFAMGIYELGRMWGGRK